MIDATGFNIGGLHITRDAEGGASRNKGETRDAIALPYNARVGLYAQRSFDQYHALG